MTTQTAAGIPGLADQPAGATEAALTAPAGTLSLTPRRPLSPWTRRRVLRLLYRQWADVKSAEGRYAADACPILAGVASDRAAKLLAEIRAIEAES